MSSTEVNAPTATAVPDAPAAAALGLPARAPRRVRAGDRTRPERRADLVSGAALLGMVAAVALIVLDAATLHSPLVPPQPHIADYLKGIGTHLSYHVFLIAMLVFSAGYAVVLVRAQRIPARWAVIAIGLLHLIVLAGPVLLSQDIFSYIAYGRLGVVHHLDPFSHGPIAAHHDRVYRFVGIQWKHVASAYGPLFTLLSYPLAPLGVPAAMWGMKILATAASLGMTGLVWLCARRLGREPLRPTLAVGLNPLLIVYGVGGAHNDLIMAALMMLGVWLTLGNRDLAGAAAIVAGTAVKATAAVLLPFMVLGRRRLGVITGAAVALFVVGLVAFAVFGAHALDFVSVLQRQQSFVSSDSFPTEVTHLFGLPGIFPVDRLILRVGLVALVLYLMVRVWRGYDWVAASAWALLIIAVTTTWLLAWYILWALPLAAIARDRRVLGATLFVQALFLAHQMNPLFSPL